MKSTLVKLSVLSLVIAFLPSCKSGFQTDKATGAEYQFIKHNESGAKPVTGNIAYVKLIAKAVTISNGDTELYNSNKNRNPRDTNRTFPVAIQKSFAGSLEDGLTLMSVGDSAIFHVNTDSFYTRLVHSPVPKNIKATSPISFYVKLTGIKTREQIQQEQMAIMQQHKDKELTDIKKYLADNHYDKLTATSDSILYLERSGGKGEQVKEGDSLYVTYSGSLLNGKVFDASELHPDHAPLKFVYTSAGGFIQGWLIALGTMHEGEKIKILVPFSLAYGPQQRSAEIVPFSTLVFDMQVIKIKHNKTAPQAAPQMMMPPPQPHK